MKRLKLISLTVVGLAVLFLLSGTAALSAVTKSAEQPEVVQAIAPNYPAVARATRSEGEVVVEVKIDAEGKVKATKVISGHQMLHKACESAAAQWRFEPSQGSPERSVMLVFAFSTSNEIKRDDPELIVSFKPPYRVEVKFNPPIVH